MTFTMLNLADERVLIKGTDSQGTDGQTVVFATEWNEVKRRQQFAEHSEDFDAAVEEFFAPLMEAATKLEDALAVPKPDPISYVVFDEGVESTPGRQREVHKLSHDSIVLRLIESGDHDRLVWVGDRLEVLAVLPGSPSPTPVAGDPHADEPTEFDGTVG